MAKEQVINNKGKGSKEEDLPHRHALTTLTKGDPVQRSLQNYAKKTPSAPDGMYPNFVGMGPRPF